MEEDKNYISMIHGDLTRAAQMQNGKYRCDEHKDRQPDHT